MEPKVEFDNRVYVCGNRVLLESVIRANGSLVEAAETWLYINGEPAVQTLTVGGLARFHLELPMGVYMAKLALYRFQLPADGGVVEVTLFSDEFPIKVSRPWPQGRILGWTLCPGHRCITRSEVEKLLPKVKTVLARHGVGRAYIFGGVVNRGFSCHDVDLFVEARLGPEGRALLEEELRRTTCLPFDVFDLERRPQQGKVRGVIVVD